MLSRPWNMDQRRLWPRDIFELRARFQVFHQYLLRMYLYHRLLEYNQLFNVTLWDSHRAKLFISSTNPSDIFLFIMAVFMLVIIVLGFGFYLWFFFTSSEHSQVRLLIILNVYLSIGCMEGSIVAFIKILASGLPGLPWKQHGAYLGGLQHGSHGSDLSPHLTCYFLEPIQARSLPWALCSLEALGGATNPAVILRHYRGFHPLSL